MCVGGVWGVGVGVWRWGWGGGAWVGVSRRYGLVFVCVRACVHVCMEVGLGCVGQGLE